MNTMNRTMAATVALFVEKKKVERVSTNSPHLFLQTSHYVAKLRGGGGQLTILPLEIAVRIRPFADLRAEGPAPS